jgi:hypothetical protein
MAEYSVLPMMRNLATKSLSAEQCLLGSIVLALAVAACMWLLLGLPRAAPAYLITCSPPRSPSRLS